MKLSNCARRILKPHDRQRRFADPSRCLSDDNEGYCPHFVVDGKKDWLGVRAVRCPDFVSANEEREVDFELMYASALDYRDLSVGSRFAIHEGPKVVGTGIVIEHQE